MFRRKIDKTKILTDVCGGGEGGGGITGKAQEKLRISWASSVFKTKTREGQFTLEG